MSSSVATAAFLAAWGVQDSRPCTLVKLDLSGQMVRICSGADNGGPVVIAGEGTFEDVIHAGTPVRDPGSYLGCGPEPSSCSVSLLGRRRLSWQAAGESIATLPKSFRLKGRPITVYLWERSLTTFSDALPRPKNGIVSDFGFDAEAGLLTLHITSRRAFNIKLPTLKITKAAYPNAPEGSIGGYAGIVAGDWSSLAMRTPPWSTAYGKKKDHEDIGSQQPCLPTIVVDRGTGANPLKVLVASHVLKALVDDTLGLRARVEGMGGEAMGMIDSAQVAAVNAAGGAGLTIADEQLLAWYPVQPVDVRASGTYPNQADNARNALDLDETNFATLDQGAGKQRLALVLPNMSALGDLQTIEIVVLYDTYGNANASTVGPVRITDGHAFTTVNLPASATPTVARGTWDPASMDAGTWNIGHSNGVGLVDIHLNAGANQKMRIYAIGLAVSYKPALTVVGEVATRTAGDVRYLWDHPLRLVKKVLHGLQHPTANFANVQPVVELRSPIYMSVQGAKDDLSGTFTTTPSSLIKYTPDLMRWLLSLGGEDGTADFTDAGVSPTYEFGSFDLARSTLLTFEGTTVEQSLFVNQETRLLELLRQMASEAGCQIELDPFTDLWVCHPWRRQPPPDYRRKLCSDDFESVKIGIEADDTVAHDVSVEYLLSPATGRRAYTAFVSKDNSDTGYTANAAGDQLLAVVAGNKVMKFDVGAGALTATMDEATYDPGIDLAANLQAKLRAASDADWYIGHGRAIKANYNDQIMVKVSGVDYTITIPPYNYTPWSLARKVEALLNAAGTGLTWAVFGLSYNTFWISATAAWTARTTQLKARTAWLTLGLTTALGVETGILTADIASASISGIPNQGATCISSRREERFWAYRNANNGKFRMTDAATTCGPLLGWLTTADVTPIGPKEADNRRGTRQTQAATLADAARYGEREPLRISSSTIRLWNVAASRRDTEFDFRKEAPVSLVGVGKPFCDLRRGSVIELDPATMDVRAPYPRELSAGSHAGRAYRVVEVETGIGPDYKTRFTAYEMEQPPA